MSQFSCLTVASNIQCKIVHYATHYSATFCTLDTLEWPHVRIGGYIVTEWPHAASELASYPTQPRHRSQKKGKAKREKKIREHKMCKKEINRDWGHNYFRQYRQLSFLCIWRMWCAICDRHWHVLPAKFSYFLKLRCVGWGWGAIDMQFPNSVRSAATWAFLPVMLFQVAAFNLCNI